MQTVADRIIAFNTSLEFTAPLPPGDTAQHRLFFQKNNTFMYNASML
ncbi:hypothetical protein KL86DPRO_11479 [uncultured delta proteobacterium]|uniref:Uncharacterized protein n=1 Tax=uncultured delta proteobacterium TaxID=34034 RepID=A0A212JHS2_9DELT|nr:hypothetical protein KL86DPRO_11479 [uncultured delta proteobacterium]